MRFLKIITISGIFMGILNPQEVLWEKTFGGRKPGQRGCKFSRKEGQKGLENSPDDFYITQGVKDEKI